MQVSVIIPVYKAEAFVRQAVESALAQPETREVLLIEDASPDNSWQVCLQLDEQYDKVRLFRHPDGKNHGAGATRNVGLREARCDYISFLDADDFFLPNRFTVAQEIFQAHPEADGVYEAIGFYFDNEAIKQRWQANKPGHPHITTMRARLPPEQFFEAQSPMGDVGYATTGGWVVKRTIFNETGPFDVQLPLHQDTVMYLKLAAVGRMFPGRLDEPVALRRVHAHNRVTAPRPPWAIYDNYLLMWLALWSWGRFKLSAHRQELVLRKLVRHALVPYNKKTRRGFQSIKQLGYLLRQCPSLATWFLFWKLCLLYFRDANKPT
ncbi:MAG: glycosyltransferase family 2 protein, partial [Okeania sp. SIO3B3]|nr:glycosyltransferase family 2 protein [Okeania sp. SIO3B3]